MQPNEELKNLIDASGIRKGELEERLSIPQSTLSKVVKGERKLKPQ
jgi:predicted transcriptional regulator